IGLFFLFEGIGKLGWFTDPSILAGQLDGWLKAVPAGSWSYAYLQRIAIPYVGVFARLVPLGELSSGVALIAGFGTPLFAFVGAAAGIDVELFANAVDLPLQIAVFQLGQRMNPSALQEQIPDRKAAEMRRVRDATRLAE